jgi:protein ImuB
VFSRRENNTQRIAALDEQARTLKLKPGMGIAEARAMHPSIEVVEEDVQADRRLLDGLADWCDRYTPLVALDGADGLFLDITGCAHLFGGEQAMLDDLLSRFFAQGFDARAGLASTPGAAWAAARFICKKLGKADWLDTPTTAHSPRGGMEPGSFTDRHQLSITWSGVARGSSPSPLRRGVRGRDQVTRDCPDDAPPVIAPGEEEELLAPLPLAALRLEPGIRAGLESVGLRTSGAVMSAPRAPLVRRFGRQVTLRLDQALGHVEEAISPRLPVPPLSAERMLAEPIGLVDDVEALVAMLSLQLKRDLERRGEGAERLQLQLFRVDGDVSRLTVGASRPLREPKFIQRLFHEKLAAVSTDLDAGFGFDLVRLCVLVAARLDATQTSLDGTSADSGGDIALFADRVRARLGDRAIHRARLVESHLPERAAIAVSFAESERDGRTRVKAPALEAAAALRERPVRLFDVPETVEVIAAEIPEGPPMHFRWRRTAYRVLRAEGPERIASEWWRQETGTRDYFRVEDEEGRRFWLYREGLYGVAEAPRWYMHGVFA